MQRGKAKVSLQVDAAEYDVWALSSGGRRIASVPVERIGGCLDFTADVARDKDSATWLYEIVRRDGK
jgi:hypothetical protein